MNDYSDRLKRSEWEVRPIALDLARRLIRNWHYARGGSNTATYTHGLFRKGSFWDEDCKGVAWWLPPTKSAGAATYSDWNAVLSLSRLAVADDAPKNGCTFLLARSVKLIDRKRWPCLVTYADEWRGHTGTIYKAAGWTYCGLTNPEPCYTINGVMTSRKAGPKTRTHSQMIALGARCEGRFSKHKFINLAVKLAAPSIERIP